MSMQQLSGGQRVLVVVPFSCFCFFFFYFFYYLSSAPFYPLPPLSIVFQLHLLLLQPSSYRPLSISTHKSNFGLEFASKLDIRTDGKLLLLLLNWRLSSLPPLASWKLDSSMPPPKKKRRKENCIQIYSLLMPRTSLSCWHCSGKSW